jgi:hypothetical protein
LSIIPAILQELISFAVKEVHVYPHLKENAPFNNVKNKKYAGVSGQLNAFACKLSFKRGCEGLVSFPARTNPIDYYQQTRQAVPVSDLLMVIKLNVALKLIG